MPSHMSPRLLISASAIVSRARLEALLLSRDRPTEKFATLV